MLGVPDFTRDIAEFKGDLKAIRKLLERLLELEERQQRPRPVAS